MAEGFIALLFASFVVGFLWVALLTFLAERLGAKAGGTIAGIPATMVVALLFIGITQDSAAAALSTTTVPFVVGLNALFVVLFIRIARKVAFAPALSLALFSWGAATTLYSASGIKSFAFSLLGYLASVALSWILLEKVMMVRTAEAGHVHYAASDLLLRGLIGGGTIALAVLLARLGGPLLGGIFASFPALTVALILIISPRHGARFTEGLLKSFIIGGSVNVVLFALVVRYVYVPAGVWLGTALALLASILCALFMHELVTKRMA